MDDNDQIALLAEDIQIPPVEGKQFFIVTLQSKSTAFC